MPHLPPLASTIIGSVPFREEGPTLDLIARTCPELPAWPTFVQLNPREDALLLMVDGQPMLDLDLAHRRILVKPEGREEALTDFYQHFLDQDLDYFQVPPEYSGGLSALLRRAREDPGFGPRFLKGQITGPVSFSESVLTPEGKKMLNDPELCDVAVKALGAKAAWTARQIRHTGRTPVIFIDEPGLTGFGSAFSTLSREQVVSMLNETFEAARSDGEVILGLHICGNTDWSVMTDTTVDIINFDAFGYLDNFLLYPKEIRGLLERGGYVAWGIVPTRDFSGRETAAALADQLRRGWENLARASGLDLSVIREQALITPACGMGTMTEENAVRVMDLLAETTALLSA